MERRNQLAKNNQSLCDCVAHTNRYRREHEELSEALRLERQTSQALRRELEQLRGGEQLGLGLAELAPCPASCPYLRQEPGHLPMPNHLPMPKHLSRQHQSARQGQLRATASKQAATWPGVSSANTLNN